MVSQSADSVDSVIGGSVDSDSESVDSVIVELSDSAGSVADEPSEAESHGSHQQ